MIIFHVFYCRIFSRLMQWSLLDGSLNVYIEADCLSVDNIETQSDYFSCILLSNIFKIDAMVTFRWLIKRAYFLTHLVVS